MDQHNYFLDCYEKQLAEIKKILEYRKKVSKFVNYTFILSTLLYCSLYIRRIGGVLFYITGSTTALWLCLNFLYLVISVHFDIKRNKSCHYLLKYIDRYEVKKLIYIDPVQVNSKIINFIVIARCFVNGKWIYRTSKDKLLISRLHSTYSSCHHV